MCFRPPSFDDMMTKCPECGSFNPPENTNCKKCGTDLSAAKAAAGTAAPAAPGAAPAAPGAAPAAPGAPKAPGA